MVQVQCEYFMLPCEWFTPVCIFHVSVLSVHVSQCQRYQASESTESIFWERSPPSFCNHGPYHSTYHKSLPHSLYHSFYHGTPRSRLVT